MGTPEDSWRLDGWGQNPLEGAVRLQRGRPPGARTRGGGSEGRMNALGRGAASLVAGGRGEWPGPGRPCLGWQRGGPRAKSKAPGGEGRLRAGAAAPPGLGGYGPLRRARGRRVGRRGQEEPWPRLRPLPTRPPGRGPHSRRRSVPGALSAAPPPATAAGAAGLREEEAAAGPGRRPGGTGSAARGRRPRKGRCARRGRRVLPRARSPCRGASAPPCGGRGELSPSLAGGRGPRYPQAWGRQGGGGAIDPSAPAAPGRLPICGPLHSPTYPSPTHKWQRWPCRRHSEEGAVTCLYPELPPSAGLPTRSGGLGDIRQIACVHTHITYVHIEYYIRAYRL